LQERGAVVIDADLVARAVTAPGEPAAAAILAEFGEGVRGPDGSIDRRALGSVVFADASRLRTLESIVHPAVRPRLMADVETAERDGASIVAIEAIKLIEGGLADLCDETWLVVCDEGSQRERLSARGVDRTDADRRITSQAGIVDRLRPVATRILDTSGDPPSARSRVFAALEAALARRAAAPDG
jgi:dephospho-CoA kinase